MKVLAIMIPLYIVSRILTGYMMKMLCGAEEAVCRTANYRGNKIPAIGGIVFVPLMLVSVLLLLLIYPVRLPEFMRFLLAIYCMGFAGVLDDLIGNKGIKGLKKHICRTLNGNMTTGFLKAATGFLIAFLISLELMAGTAELLVNTVVISLSANTMNLFDLRPGRAVKVYILSVIMLLSVTGISAAAPLLAMLIVSFVYLAYDLKEICMLGDTGANILGISLGYYCTLLLSFRARVFLAVILIVTNLAAERVSISVLISRNRLLSYIDTLGRGGGSR